MYRFLLSRQWVILTLIGLALIPAMIELGFWQLHRHESRVAHNELITKSLTASPVPIGQLTGPGREPAADDHFRTVTATGRYDTEHEVVVRQRTGADQQSIGYFVLTPLIQRDGTAVLVNRGWIEAGGDLTEFPRVPRPPRGQVTVTGRIMADETSAASGIKDKPGLPPRQVMLINSRQQAEALGRSVLGGYLQLTATSPKPDTRQPERIPEPDHSSIGAHMAYAVQWWLFSAAVPVGWFVLVRREFRDRRDRFAKTAGAADAGHEAETPRTPAARGGAH
ncbi:MAG: SURF1 family cytochrome oxidase biogenesis protein [Streptomyces sp.]|uniref:SURF1 family cytochrome oxidase biogenesis protein n=1 Tax=Streptomyces sp. TaxID=1931 RepID=UPI003D6AEA5E